MKKIFKKNQVIITSLAILIAVAGYLNFADVDLGIGDKEASTDNSSILDQVEYDLSDETAVADENAETAAETAEVPDGSSTPGEAVLTGASVLQHRQNYQENRFALRVKRICRRS